MNAFKSRRLFRIVVLALIGEAGIAVVLCNARPHAPLGFYLWFGGLAVAFPLYCIWLYQGARRSR